MRARSMATSAVLLAGSVTIGVLTTTPAWARPAPDYELPFPCGQEWTGTTRAGHSPSPKSVDFNRARDLGDRVVASAPGVVSRVADLGGSSYGKYVVVDHGGGETSLYAHLNAYWVVPGQVLDQGELIGQVGNTGNVTGPHLHFEERLDGDDLAPWFHDLKLVLGTTVASANCPDAPVAGDWDGDGKAQVGVFRRTASTGRFRLAQVSGPVRKVDLGVSTDLPLVGDWDGDGATDVGVWRPPKARFILEAADGTRTRILFGEPGDRPVAGDWDGDGATDVGVWRPARARFLQRLADGSKRVVVLGSVGSLPVTGDWNGDGVTDLGAFSPATGSFALRLVAKDGTVWSASLAFGSSTDLPVSGDWDGDGVTDLGVWDPGTATYTLRTGEPSTSRAARISTLRFGAPR